MGRLLRGWLVDSLVLKSLRHCHSGDTIDDMIKISLLVALLLSALWVGYQRYGIAGLVNKESRGRHCARGRGKRFGRELAQHRDGVPAWNTITGARQHLILPSRYYPRLGASEKGMAHAA